MNSSPAFPKPGVDDCWPDIICHSASSRATVPADDLFSRAIENGGATSQPLPPENCSAGSRRRCATCVEPVGHCGSRYRGRRQTKGQDQSRRSQEGFEDRRHSLSSHGGCFDERKLTKDATAGCADGHMVFLGFSWRRHRTQFFRRQFFPSVASARKLAQVTRYS